jgi:HEAT repeat protein
MLFGGSNPGEFAVLVLAFAVATGVFTVAAPVPDDAARVKSLVRQLETGSAGERVIAAELLGDLGPRADSAATAIAEVALKTRFAESTGETLYVYNKAGETYRIYNKNDEFLFNACFVALIRIGPRAAPALAKLLGHEEHYPRKLVLSHLHGHQPVPAAALPDLVSCLSDADEKFAGQAADLLGSLGPAAADAVPNLVRLFLRHRNDRVAQLAPGVLADSRPNAVLALARIGVKAEPVIRKDVLPVVLAGIKKNGTGWGLLEALGESGATAVPMLGEYVRKMNDITDGIRAAEVLPALGTAGRKEFASLIDDKNEQVRLAVILALQRQSAEFVAGFVPQLIAAMKEDDHELQVAAVRALARLGEKVSPEGIAAVTSMLKDRGFLDKLAKNHRGLLWFINDLRSFGPHGVDFLCAVLKASDPALRRWGLREFASLSPRPMAALPTLRRVATEDPDILVAAMASSVATLVSFDAADLDPLYDRGGLRSRDSQIVEQVRHVLLWARPLHKESRHELAQWREPQTEPAPEDIATLIEKLHRVPAADDPGEAFGRVARLGPRAADAVPVLAELIPKLDVSQARAALDAVAAIGPAAKDAVPAVVKRLADENDEWRIPAALCLAELGPVAKSAVPALKKLLTEPNPDLRLAASSAIARITGDFTEFSVAFERVVEREASNVPHASFAAELFERLAPHTPDLLPVAVRGLELGWRKSAVMDGIGKYGPKARAAVPQLRKVLGNPSTTTPEVEATIQALVAIGPAAREAIPDLHLLLDQPNKPVAIAARDAIRKIEAKK